MAVAPFAAASAALVNAAHIGVPPELVASNQTGRALLVKVKRDLMVQETQVRSPARPVNRGETLSRKIIAENILSSAGSCHQIKQLHIRTDS